MGTLFRWRCNWRDLLAAFVLGMALAVLLSSTSASAGEKGDPASQLADGKGSGPSTPQMPADPPESEPQWTFSAEAIGLERLGGVNQTLVARVPGNVPFFLFPTPIPPHYDSATYPGFEVLNSNQLRQGFAAGPRTQPHVPQRLRLWPRAFVFRRPGPERRQGGRPRHFGELAGHEGSWLVLADPGFSVPSHEVERHHDPVQCRGQRTAARFPARDFARGIALASS